MPGQPWLNFLKLIIILLKENMFKFLCFNFGSTFFLIVVLCTGVEGIFREPDGRGGEQLEGAFAARSRSCSSDNVHDCNVKLSCLRNSPVFDFPFEKPGNMY